MRRSVPTRFVTAGKREPLGFEQQRRTARLHGAVGDLRDLKNRIHFRRNAPQFAFFLQFLHRNPADLDTPLPLPNALFEPLTLARSAYDQRTAEWIVDESCC